MRWELIYFVFTGVRRYAITINHLIHCIHTQLTVACLGNHALQAFVWGRNGSSKEIMPAFKTSMPYMCPSTITVTKVLKLDQEGSAVNIRAFLFERSGTRAMQRRFTLLHHRKPHAPTQLLFTANAYAGIRNSVFVYGVQLVFP